MAQTTEEIRRSIVGLIYELFVRSANHADKKKQNSLILFSINLVEAKETQKDVWMAFLNIYEKYLVHSLT